MTAINANRAIRGPVTAVPLVAGKGVRLTADVENNRWVVEADETVLWDNYTFANNKASSVVMSETPFNFSYVRITFEIEASVEDWTTVQTQVIDMEALNSCINKDFTLIGTCVNGTSIVVRGSRCNFSGTSILAKSTVQWHTSGESTLSNALHIYRIVGINRIASN